MTRDTAICAAYQSGESAALVGRLYGLTERRVLQVLAMYGVPRRKHKPTVYLDLRRKSA